MRLILSLIVFLSIAAVAFWLTSDDRRSPQPMIQWKDVVLRYQIVLKNASNSAVHEAHVDILSPLDAEYQKLVKIDSGSELSVSTIHKDGKNLLKFEFPLVSPFAEKIITVTAGLSIPNSAFADTVEKAGRYLSDGEYLQVSSEEMQGAIKRFENADKQQKPRLIYKWVLENLKYAGYIQEDRGALYALKTGKGDCTEYMYLLMALLRGNDIPARGFAGFYLSRKQQIVDAEDYHNWVAYFDGKYWRILDPLNSNFDKGYGNYVVLREVTTSTVANHLSSQRFVSYDSRLAISMK